MIIMVIDINNINKDNNNNSITDDSNGNDNKHFIMKTQEKKIAYKKTHFSLDKYYSSSSTFYWYWEVSTDPWVIQNI